MAREKPVRIIGVPMDIGGNRRGVDMGPSALRIADLQPRLEMLGYRVEDGGNISVPIAEELPPASREQHFLNEVVQVCDRLARRVGGALEEGYLPLVLGGDHSLSAGSTAGTAAHYKGLNHKIGVIWVDAHTDMNTPQSSPSGNVHGMPLATLLGMGPPQLTDLGSPGADVDSRNAVVIGARSIDETEIPNIEDRGLRVITMTELDKRGLGEVMAEALEIATDGTVGFCCSFDLDVIDPREAPGVGTPVRGGLNYRESHLLMEMIADSGKMVSLEVVELNPVLDRSNATGQLGVELICSALGQRIL